MATTILSVAEKPSVARELTRIIAGVPHDSIRRQGYSNSNPVFDIEQCKFRGQPAKMKMTSVLGHLMELEFDQAYKGWGSCLPVDLFTAPVVKDVKGDFLNIKRTLVEEARKCNVLMLWLDCDLEGENIAFEVIKVCLEANPRLDVYRARFSALIDRDIIRTMQYPERPNPHMNDAVDARQEIDLRIGAAFTRFQTLRLQKKFENVGNAVISYGPCQFPTLGFVVDRDLRIKAFQPDNFWYLTCEVEFDNPDNDDGSKLSCTFHWDRTRVYDKFACVVLFEACVEDIDRRPAVVTHSNERPTSKIRPLPLNTIELQKRASRFLKISSERTMHVAETLYQRGILSYPRTETDFFKEGFELLPLLQEHRGHHQWGAFATALVDNGGFEPPRRGQKDDQAHPPIHPTKCVNPQELESDEERRVYDLVVRHFLACCSKDARGSQTKLSICLPEQGGESFSATGLMVLERNWLEVYTYEYWGASKVPRLQVGDAVVPKRLTMAEGRTSPPEPLTESDLITAMDQHGIGTDATIATHISTIQAREYVIKDAQNRFVPTKLGLALVEGYNSMGYQLNKPQLRAAIEADVQRIARGELSKAEAVRKCLDTMRTCFVTCNREAARLDEAMSRYFSGLGVGGGQGGEATVVQYDTLTCNLSTCGACRVGMDLRVERGANRESAPRFLYCVSCRQAHVVPGKGELTPHTVSCAICGFQALTVRNKDSGKEHTVCPKCFADPPPAPDGIEGAAEFRCFSCARESCELSGRIAGSDVDVAPCIEPQCTGKMRVRRVGPKSGGSYMLACSSTAGNCKAVWWMPKFVRSAVPQTGNPCPRCLERHGVTVARILFNFHLSKAPPVGLEPECVLCPSCDSLWRQVDTQPLPILARPWGNGRLQPLPPQQRQPQQPQGQYQMQQPPPARPYQQPPAQLRPPDAPQTHVPLAQSVPAAYSVQSRLSSAYPQPPSSSSTTAPPPSCQCGLPCKLLTTTKAGDNQGRQFYSCPRGRESGCNHFQWADEPPRPQSGGGFAGSRGVNGGTAESAQRPGPSMEAPLCQCGTASTLCTVNKEGENKGRRFFGCRSRECKFFQWEDELTSGKVVASKPWAKRSGDTLSKPFIKRDATNNADISAITCSHCKKRGHGSRFCPEKM